MKAPLVFFLALIITGSAIAESRVWTSTNGRTVEAELVGQTATNVQLKRNLDDVVLDVAIASLSVDDQKFVKAAAPAAAIVPKAKRVSGVPSFPDNSPQVPSQSIQGHEAVISTSQPLTYRSLLDAYSSGGKPAAVVRFWKSNPMIAQGTLAGLQQLAADANKANDPKARTYTRALDKLTQQLNEAGVRSDAQSAVADALKAIDESK